MTIGIAIFDRDIAAFREPNFIHALEEGCGHRCRGCGSEAGKKAHYPYRGLLRLRSERPCCSTAEKANELTSPHIAPKSGTSIVSAQVSTLIGLMKSIAPAHRPCR